MEEVRRSGAMSLYSVRSWNMSDLLMVMKELRSSRGHWEQSLTLSLAFMTLNEADHRLLLQSVEKGIRDEKEDVLWLLPHVRESDQRRVVPTLDDETLMECFLLWWVSSEVRRSAELIGKPTLRVILPLEENSPSQLMTARWVLDRMSPYYLAVIGHSTRAQYLLRLLPCVTKEETSMVPYCDAFGCRPSSCTSFRGYQGYLSHSPDTPSLNHTEEIQFLTQNSLSSELQPLRRCFVSQYNEVVHSYICHRGCLRGLLEWDIDLLPSIIRTGHPRRRLRKISRL